MKNILYFTLIFLLFSCESRKKEDLGNQEIIVVDIDNTSCESLPVFNNFNFVSLELTESSMLADIGKVVCAKNRLYVLSISEPTLFIFTRQGKFEKKLSKGQGPGEVISVSDITVYKDTLYILDRYRSVKMYNLAGEYIKDKVNLESPYFSMALNTGGMYLFDPNIDSRSDYNLCYMSTTGEKKQYLQKEKDFKDVGVLFYNPFCNSDYFTWPLSNVIYKMSSKGEIRPVYEIDFKGKWITGQDYKSAVTNEDMCGGKLDLYARWLKDFMPIKNGCFFSFRYRKKDYFAKYQDGKLSLHSSLFVNMPEMRESSVGSIGDSLIYTYSIADLKEYMEKSVTFADEKVKSIYKLCKNEDLNPILVFASVK